MKKGKSHILSGRQAMFFLMTYLFCALAYLFFIPNCNTSLSNRASAFNGIGFSKPTVNCSYQNMVFVQMIDRSTLDDDQHHIIKSVSVILLVIFSGFVLLELISRLIPPELYHPRNKQYSYLVFRIFRI